MSMNQIKVLSVKIYITFRLSESFVDCDPSFKDKTVEPLSLQVEQADCA